MTRGDTEVRRPETERVRERQGRRGCTHQSGVGLDERGRTRLLLNGEPYLHVSLLDQGLWPDGLATATSDAAMVHEIETARPKSRYRRSSRRRGPKAGAVTTA